MAQRLKRLPVMRETRVRSLSWEDPLEKEMQPTPVLLPGESHGRRSLAGYSPRGHKRVRHDSATKQQQKEKSELNVHQAQRVQSKSDNLELFCPPS